MTREEIARIIDPIAFDQCERWSPRRRDSGGPSWSVPTTAIDRAEASLERALAKADAILALAKPGADVSEGWRLVPLEITGEMWSAARSALSGPVSMIQGADSYEMASAHADRIPEKLWPVLLAAAPPPPSQADDADGWRPIETAPKDGTRILVWREAVVPGAPYCDVTAWPKNWTGLWPTAYMHYADGHEPTHWQPLPPLPPQPKEGER